MKKRAFFCLLTFLFLGAVDSLACDHFHEPKTREEKVYGHPEDGDEVTAQTPAVQGFSTHEVTYTRPHLSEYVCGGYESQLIRLPGDKKSYRFPVDQANTYPYACVGQVFSSNQSFFSTGFLVGPCHVLTSKSLCKPGPDLALFFFKTHYGGGYFSKNPCKILEAFSIETGNTQMGEDLLLLILDKPLGLLTGWLGLAQTPFRILENRVVEMVGLSHHDQGQSLWTAMGKILEGRGPLLSHNMETYPGHGGSPILASLEGMHGFYAIGAHANEGLCFNIAVHFTRGIFNQILPILQKTSLRFPLSFLPPLKQDFFSLESQGFTEIPQKKHSTPSPKEIFPMPGHEMIQWHHGLFPFEDLSSHEKNTFMRTASFNPHDPFAGDPHAFWDAVHGEIFYERTRNTPRAIPTTHQSRLMPVGRLETTFLAQKTPGQNVPLTFHGTGFLVGPRHVLTSAHTLFDPNIKGIKAMGSMVQGTFTWGEENPCTAQIVGTCVPPIWQAKRQGFNQMDYALALLDQEIGREWGWFGLADLSDFFIEDLDVQLIRYGTHTQTSMDARGVKTHAYPIDLKEITKHSFAYDFPFGPGDSGSPLIAYLENMGPVVIGLHQGHRNAQSHSQRINRGAFMWIMGKLARFSGVQSGQGIQPNFTKQHYPYGYLSYQNLGKKPTRHFHHQMPTKQSPGHNHGKSPTTLSYDKIGDLSFKPRENEYDNFHHGVFLSYFRDAKNVHKPLFSALKLAFLHDLEALPQTPWGLRKNALLAKLFYRGFYLRASGQPNDQRESAEALCRLGALYQNTQKGPRQRFFDQKAFGLFRDAAHLSKPFPHEEALLRLAECYEEGRGVPKSVKKALEIYKAFLSRTQTMETTQEPGISYDYLRDYATYLFGRSLEAHDPDELPHGLGRRHSSEFYEEVCDDIPQAAFALGRTSENQRTAHCFPMEFYEKALSPKSIKPYLSYLHPKEFYIELPPSRDAYMRMGKLKRMSKKNQRHHLFMDEMIKAASMNHPGALYQVALYFDVNPSLSSVENAREVSDDLYRLSANAGNKRGQYAWAERLQNGNQNAMEAFHLFQRSSKKNHIPSLYQLGRCYFHGYGTPCHLGKAYDAFLASFEGGYKKSGGYLGLYHETGLYPLGEKNRERAAFFFLSASQQSDPLALSKLGFYLEKGIIYPKNLSLARLNYETACRWGHAYAFYRMGRMKERNDWGSKAFHQSWVAYAAAALRGSFLAFEGLERLGLPPSSPETYAPALTKGFLNELFSTTPAEDERTQQAIDQIAETADCILS